MCDFLRRFREVRELTGALVVGRKLTFELDFEGHGIGKLLVPLIVRRQAARELSESHANLKRRLEGSDRTTGAK